MKVLVACEESQRVCTAFRERGHEAYSCDIQEPSGGHPEWHILGDCLPYINGRCDFKTMDGIKHTIEGKWDLLIAHPPCTYLSSLWYADTKIEKPKPIRVGKNGKNVYFTEGCSKNQKSERSKTFPGIARAMAEQWGKENPAPL